MLQTYHNALFLAELGAIAGIVHEVHAVVHMQAIQLQDTVVDRHSIVSETCAEGSHAG